MHVLKLGTVKLWMTSIVVAVGPRPDSALIFILTAIVVAHRSDAMPLDIRIRFGRAIRRVREELKINQEEAAERCGLHRTYYSGVERGVRGTSHL